MRIFAGAALVALAALVQVTWGSRLALLGAFPNLVLVAVVAAAWTVGPRAAMLWACAGGLLLDLGSSGAVGPHALALLPGVYAVGLLARNLDRPHALHVVLSAAIATLLYTLLLVLVYRLLGVYVPGPGIIAKRGIAAAVYNAMLVPFFFELVRRFQVRTRPRRDAAPTLTSRRISRRAQA